MGCDITLKGKSSSALRRSEAESHTNNLVRISSVDSNEGDWMEVQVDPESGKLKQELWLNLTYQPSPGSVVEKIGSCLHRFASDQEVGEVQCIEPKGQRVSLQGRHLRQFCGLKDYSEDQPPAETVEGLKQCQRARAALHQFSTELRLEVMSPERE